MESCLTSMAKINSKSSLSIDLDACGYESLIYTTHVCDQCGKEYKRSVSHQVWQSDFDKKTFCSYNCRCAYYKANAEKRETILRSKSYLYHIDKYDEQKQRDRRNYLRDKHNQKGLYASKSLDEIDFKEMAKKFDNIIIKNDSFNRVKVYIDCKVKDIEKAIQNCPPRFLERKIFNEEFQNKTVILIVSNRTKRQAKKGVEKENE